MNIFWKIIVSILLLLCVFIASCSKEETMVNETDAGKNPHFIWDISIELEQPNNWCLTVYTEKIAITNLSEGKQYLLTWKGGLSAGQKTKGILKTIVRDGQTRITDLDVLEIKESGDNTYELFLRGGGRKGEMVFHYK